MAKIDVRKGMPDVHLTRQEFAKRFRDRFFDPAFAAIDGDVERVIDTAWSGYDDYRKSPRQRRAGRGFAKPGKVLPVEWLAARQAIRDAAKRYRSKRSPSRILIVNGSSRTNQSCPGEMSKSWRLVESARHVVEAEKGFEADVLDLSRLTSEYGRVIYPCKACVSTAMPLCHWPCSCYPNYAMGQVNDWMHEIYPRFVAAHGVMIVSPVNWYMAPSGLKAMIDRLVCADGGNPDPTTTDGKDPAKAKALELKGWPYPRHLGGRLFSVVVHGDTAGVENLRRMLTDWLTDMHLIPAAPKAMVGSYIGYYEPYATSHAALDRDKDFQEETRNAARSLIGAVKLQRAGRFPQPDAGLPEPRPK